MSPTIVSMGGSPNGFLACLAALRRLWFLRLARLADYLNANPTEGNIL